MKWWQKAVFYQIYPRSFADGNGDGIGDLRGIIEKLEYIQDLGVDAIWLSPHYPSPMVDCGYDISDYCDVAPEYGTLADFQILVDEVHHRGMRIVLDLVLNHTSDQHPWFLEARSSRENPKHDWYVWREGNEGLPPNNWYSTFGGSAWEWNATTDEYYYNFFYKEQPDLNWPQPQVREAMFDVVRFWLKMGVDGFRLDAVGTIFENPDLPDHTCSIDQDELYKAYRLATTDKQRSAIYQLGETMYRDQHDQPEVHTLMKELRQVVDEFEDRVLIGETDDIAFYGDGNDELHLAFNFPLMKTNRLSAEWVRENQVNRLSALPVGVWPCNTLNNHDTGRVYSNFGDGIHDEALAKLSLAVVLTLKGTPFLYNGEEIGMRNYYGFSLEQFRDPESIRAYGLERRLLQKSEQEALEFAARHGRDKGRTPMQWDNSENAGFSPAGIQPWLPVSQDNIHGVNVANQISSNDSLWHYYRDLLILRKETPALVAGDYLPLNLSGNVLGFIRQTDSQKVLVLINFDHELNNSQSSDSFGIAKRLYSSDPEGSEQQVSEGITLQPFEVWIGKIAKNQ
jgi:alpha-glucosidase